MVKKFGIQVTPRLSGQCVVSPSTFAQGQGRSESLYDIYEKSRANEERRRQWKEWTKALENVALMKPAEVTYIS